MISMFKILEGIKVLENEYIFQKFQRFYGQKFRFSKENFEKLNKLYNDF